MRIHHAEPCDQRPGESAADDRQPREKIHRLRKELRHCRAFLRGHTFGYAIVSSECGLGAIAIDVPKHFSPDCVFSLGLDKSNLELDEPTWAQQNQRSAEEAAAERL
jgi:hypothetical protein